MAERDIQAAALLALSRGAVRLFRNNTGTGWAGTLIRKFQVGRWFNVELKNARPLHAGLCVGSADTIGWRTIEVTPAMVGKRVAVFTAIEFKNRRTVTDEQRQFLHAVKSAGGIAGVAHSVDEARDIVELYSGGLSHG